MSKTFLVIPWSPFHPAGVSVVVRNLVEQYKRSGVDTAVCQDDWGYPQPTSGKDGIEYFRFGMLGGTGPVALLKSLLVAPFRLATTAAWLRKNAVGCVNFHYVGQGALSIACLKALGLFRGKLVLSFHGTDVQLPDSAIEARLQHFYLKQADTLTFCSRALAQKAAQVFGFTHKDVRVVYNGVNTAIFRPGLEADPALPKRYVVQVGSFIIRKRQVFLVEAFARVAADHPDLHLVLIGMDGPELEKARDLAARHGLAERFHTLMNLTPEQVAGIVSNAAVCVQPSVNEPFGIAVIEAGACGVPVAASRVEGHMETIHHEQSGLLFEVDNVDACAISIRRLIDNRDSALAMARRMKENVDEKFTWEQCAQAYARTYAPG